MRAPVMAAGGIVVRTGARPQIAVVQRRKDDRWVLPKGKLKPGEKALAAARREVVEETGHQVVVHEFLGALTYDRRRKAKVVQFWRMEAADLPPGDLMRDIKAVRWLSLRAATAKLDDPLEAVFLRHIGRRVVMLSRMTPTVAADSAGTPGIETPVDIVAPIDSPAFGRPVVEPLAVATRAIQSPVNDAQPADSSGAEAAAIVANGGSPPPVAVLATEVSDAPRRCPDLLRRALQFVRRAVFPSRGALHSLDR